MDIEGATSSQSLYLSLLLDLQDQRCLAEADWLKLDPSIYLDADRTSVISKSFTAY